MSTTPKILIVGDAAVGKTALVHRLLTGTYSEGYAATIGVEVHPVKIAPPNSESGELTLTVNLWDIHGNQALGMGEAYYTRADVVVICFAVDRPDPVRTVKGWEKKMFDHFDVHGEQQPKVILVGTKKDTKEDLEELCTHYAPPILLSAKTGEGVEELCRAIARAVQ